jgi:hypothetical protein
MTKLFLSYSFISTYAYKNKHKQNAIIPCSFFISPNYRIAVFVQILEKSLIVADLLIII